MARFFLPFLLVCAGVLSAQHPSDNDPFPAYKIVGNVYYVGASDITSYLITTRAGHFLVNSGYETTPALIRASIVKLGFKPTDVKIILNGQAHWDHVAGQAAMQKMTGAKIYSSEAEVAVLETGGKADPRGGREQTYRVV